MRLRLFGRLARVVPVAVLLLAAAPTRADQPGATPTTTAPLPDVPGTAEAPPVDAIPGSPTPIGLGLSPEAPHVEPAPGGRAPSFGAPNDDPSSSFRIGGRFFGWEAVGIGQHPGTQPQGYSGTAIHAPLLSTGKIPFWGGAGGTLNLQYGTKHLTAYVAYYFRTNSDVYNGYWNPALGPGFGTAYLLMTPDPLGSLHLQFRVGAFVENYAGPGQWGWGIFGPMLALRGYGYTATGDWDLNRRVHMQLVQGFLIVPGVSEDFPRGDYNSWIETGVSSYVAHAHVGWTLDNQWIFRLHYATDHGTDERTYLKTFLGTPPQDGRMDVYLGEVRWTGVPWGQFGISGGLYNFTHAAAVGDGIWWGIDFTQGARDMTNKFLGPQSGGNGAVATIGGEWDFSVSSLLWYPRSFTGQAPDLRVSIAAQLTRTVATDDPNYKNMNGYYTGIETEYRFSQLFSLTLQTYGETRGSYLGDFSVYSINPGIAFHSDWLSTDRIQLIYGRRFYSRAADPNSAQPLDRNMLALGGYITF
ncbi:MAG TPA: hypothetical protein VKZ18_13635 [Polyangia bacterium]|nr:hypothetical protein [Polyangia bacterium]